MKCDLGRLLELQRVTTDLRRYKERSALCARKIQEIEKNTARLNEELATTQSKLSYVQKQLRDGEMELKNLEEKQTALKKRSAVVRTPKECEALEHEISVLEQKRSAIEEQLLTLMEENEKLERFVEQKKREIDEARAQFEAERKRVNETHQQANALVHALAQDETRLLSELGEEIAEIYRRLMGRMDLPAVVPIVQATCGGCGTQLPIHFVQELKRSGEVEICPHCRRLVYYGQPAEPSDRN
ncbi:MAG: zinc ribbon domain-containing protein [Candidatus Sumerlaeaceae bacterium]